MLRKILVRTVAVCAATLLMSADALAWGACGGYHGGSGSWNRSGSASYTGRGGNTYSRSYSSSGSGYHGGSYSGGGGYHYGSGYYGGGYHYGGGSYSASGGGYYAGGFHPGGFLAGYASGVYSSQQ